MHAEQPYEDQDVAQPLEDAPVTPMPVSERVDAGSDEVDDSTE